MLCSWAVVVAAGQTAALDEPVLLVVALLATAAFGRIGAVLALLTGFLGLFWRALMAAADDPHGLSGLLDPLLWLGLAGIGVVLVALPRRMLARQIEAARAVTAQARQETLLRTEMAHRMTNDLQRLVGLLHAEAMAQPEAARSLRQAAERVQILGRVHRTLSHRSDERLVDSAAFIEGLVADLRATLGTDRRITLQAKAESHPLPMATASDVGLVVNELLTNALKHAFPADRAGSVTVTFGRQGESFLLRVRDDGIGLQASGPGRPGHLGQRLLRALASQLRGTLAVRTAEGGGAEFELIFRAPIDAEAASPTVHRLSPGPATPVQRLSAPTRRRSGTGP